jgi:tetratricopeptide (TPR) repeat protein
MQQPYAQVRIALGLLDKRIEMAVSEEDFAAAARLRDERTESLESLSPQVQILVTRLDRLCRPGGSVSVEDRAVAANALMEARDTRALPSLAAALRVSPGHVGDGNRQHSLVEMTMWELFAVSGDPAVDARLQDGVLAMRVPGEGLELARDIFTEVTALAPSFAEGWNKRATTNYLLRDFRAAIEDCRRTLELNASHFGALSGMGLCHLGLSEFAQADEAFAVGRCKLNSIDP